MPGKSTTKREIHEASVLEDLANLVHGITAPFACGGSLVPDAPIELHFTDGTTLTAPRAESAWTQPDALEPLMKRCAPAPVGRGRRTYVSRRVRDAFQLQAKDTFSVPGFDPAESGILDAVRRALAPHDPNPLTAELYNLNVYAHEGHFEPHKDTPRGTDMIGTLVVCLPPQFSGGRLVVTHHGAHALFNWESDAAREADPRTLTWAAFFGDVDHSIEYVHLGARVTLAYILRRGQGAVPPAPPVGSQTERLRGRLDAALADRRFLPRGGVLGFPCFHMYSQETGFQGSLPPLTEASALALKGVDQHVAAAALQAGLAVSLQPYLTEECADQTWQLATFPTPKAQRKMGRRMDPWKLEKALPIVGPADEDRDFGVTWVVRPPSFNFAPRKPAPMSSADTESPDPEAPAVLLFHQGEYSGTGYFGNEGSDTAFYVYAALHVTVPPFGEGPRRAKAKPSKRSRAG
jgi:hypothetical protein